MRRTAVRTDLTNISRVCGRQVDGLLGADFLRNKILTINMASHTLHIEPVPGTDNAPARMMDDISFNRQDAVFVKITTPFSKRPLVFLVDTGTMRCCIDSKAAKRMNLPLGAKHTLNMVGEQKMGCTVDNFAGSYDGHPLPPQILAVDLSQLSWSFGHHIDGVMGMDFMENYTVKINFRSHQMQLLPNRAADFRVAAR